MSQVFEVTSCGALPPYSVTYIDPEVCATSQPQWFVMGTVDGDPRNGCGPVAICEHEPSAHVIASLLNAHNGCIAAHAPGRRHRTRARGGTVSDRTSPGGSMSNNMSTPYRLEQARGVANNEVAYESPDERSVPYLLNGILHALIAIGTELSDLNDKAAQ